MIDETNQGLNLLLTYRCNFHCDHCLANCSPDRSEQMSYEQAVSYIDIFAQEEKPWIIGYTGGEAFLLYDTMKSLMKYSFDTYGIKGGVVTNCFWAASLEKAFRIIRELKECGLRSIVVSYDTYHLKFVPASHIKNVIIAAVSEGIYTVVNTVVSNSEKSKSGSLLLDNLQLLPNIRESQLLKSHELSLLIKGRALNEANAQLDLSNYASAPYMDKCYSIMKTPAIDPMGNFYGCCCFGDSSKNTENLCAYIGNTNENDLKQLISEMHQNLLFNLLAELGPYKIMQFLLSRTPDLPFSGRYVVPCDICKELYENKQIRAGLREWLELFTPPIAFP